ncbi:PLP-dependent aminotransferase family protein [Streptomyces sp. NPDC092296]|uniref:aminotransferase-like domain-containing protein n=1 Tax=Streptomyces sp. NPDC092296 TaxID=3366012 RepID=UPI0038036B8B
MLPAAEAPVRRRGRLLQSAFREAVRSGRLRAGTLLPSSRELARDLGVSRGLVTEAYGQLLAEGYLTSRQGAGTWVAGLPGTTADARTNGGSYGAPGTATGPRTGPDTTPGRTPGTTTDAPTNGRSPGAPGTAARIGAAPRAGAAAPPTQRPGRSPDPAPVGGRAVVDFRPGLADLAAFPRAGWAAALRGALDRLPHAALDYPDPRGLPELREALAELLARRRGVAVDPDGLVVCSGVAQALGLLGRVLYGRGQRAVALEDPGSPGQLPLFTAAGLRCLPLPVREDGPDLAVLEHSGARAVVVTPSHQFPTGVAPGPVHRAALLGWAERCGGLVVEDDYDGDFRYDRAPVGALQGLAPDRVAYTGSVSKSLAPGLRLGWLVPPPGLLAEVVEAKRVTDLGNAVLEQAAFAEFVRSGRYDRQLRRCQRHYRRRRDVLIGALGRELPAVRVAGIAAGLHLVARFPAEYGDAGRVRAAAAGAGVRLRPMADHRLEGHRLDGGGPADFVLGYAHLTPPEIERAVTAVAAALHRSRTGV